MDSISPIPPRCQGILVIDDEKDIRESLQQLFELEGFPVRIAANGQEGLAQLNASSGPQLVFLDLMMPVMDGWAFAEALEAADPRAENPVVVISAFAEKGRAIRARAVIKKPLDVDLMVEWAERLVERGHGDPWAHSATIGERGTRGPGL
jgi:two-component system response regulator MprA